jgi:hypothetical protein
MKHKKIVITGLSILIVVMAVYVFKDQIFSHNQNSDKSTKQETPRIVALDFYNGWLADLKSASTTPYNSGILNSEALSAEVRAQIERAHENSYKDAVDPVLCLPRIPNRIVAKDIHSTDSKAIIVISPRDKRIETEHQAIVGLAIVDGKWLITKIDCAIGEMVLPKEFDFEKSGLLLKQSIQPPYNNQNWHLVYEQETEAGFVIPLTFTADSVCVHTDKSEHSCDTNSLTETTKVFIQADMTETGAIVKKLTFE